MLSGFFVVQIALLRTNHVTKQKSYLFRSLQSFISRFITILKKSQTTQIDFSENEVEKQKNYFPTRQKVA